MKRRVLILCLLLAIVGGILGCGKTRNIKPRPSDEELAKASTVCGIVREVDDEVINVQLCGSTFDGSDGKCYIEVKNEYDSLNEDESVMLYYTGRIKYEMVDEDIEASGIDVCYIESYDNDGSFKGYLIPAGNFGDENGEFPADDPRSGGRFFITPLENEPECNFAELYYNNAEDKIEMVFKGEYLGISDEVTVTYDVDTMEIISIIQ